MTTARQFSRLTEESVNEAISHFEFEHGNLIHYLEDCISEKAKQSQREVNVKLSLEKNEELLLKRTLYKYGFRQKWTVAQGNDDFATYNVKIEW